MTQQEIQEMNESFVAFKSANDAMQAEIKKYGSASSSTTEKVEKLSLKLDSLETSINKRMDGEETIKQFKAFTDRLDEFEAMLKRRTSAASGSEGDQKKAAELLERKAFLAAMRWTPFGSKTLHEALGPDLVKALIVSNDTQGGYLAPVEYVNEILANVVEWSPVRNVCRVRATTRQAIQIPKRTTTAAAAWVAETGTRVETTNPAFGMENIQSHEMYAMTKVSKQELEDSQFDLEGFLNAEFSEQFGLTEGAAFISGTGVGQPEGMLTNSSVSYTASGAASNITADGLIAIYYDLKEAYLLNSSWIMNRSTLKVVRQLKDGQGQYLWAPGIRVDARPSAILDRPYMTAPDMPAINTNTYPILFGDFKRGYLILDRLVMEMMSDPYTSKSTGMVEFSARRRVGGQVIIAEAIRKLKCATT
jgi:HK97 family phage major capsid protein